MDPRRVAPSWRPTTRSLSGSLVTQFEGNIGGTKWVTSAQSAETGPPTANLGQVSRGNVCCQIAAKNDQGPSLISPEGPLTCTYFVVLAEAKHNTLKPLGASSVRSVQKDNTRRRLNDADRRQVVALYESGMSTRSVAGDWARCRRGGR